MSQSENVKQQPSRIASVDAARGLTILLMVFVNDLGPAAPSWMHHIQPPDADGMTLADIVFPFFLFIAGVSIPLAVRAARHRGDSETRILWHSLTRSAALVLMGLVGVNRGAEIRLGATLWGLLAYVAIILAWCIVPRSPGRKRTALLSMKWLGAASLVTLLILYRREPVTAEVLFRGTVADWTWLTTSWWGILGLIGWAYLVTSLLYLLLGHRREWLMAAVGLLMLNFIIAGNGGYFTRIDDKLWLEPLLPMITLLRQIVELIDSYVPAGSLLGSLPSIMMAGCVLGTVLLPESDAPSSRVRIRWSLTYAAGLFLAGLMTDTFGGINKIAATPTWCFWCSALATLLWLLLYLVIDVRGITGWTIIVRPAGANPLIAYLLHPIILFVLSLTGLSGTLHAYTASSAGIVIAGSLTMALVVCGLTGLIARAGLRIRV